MLMIAATIFFTSVLALAIFVMASEINHYSVQIKAVFKEAMPASQNDADLVISDRFLSMDEKAQSRSPYRHSAVRVTSSRSAAIPQTDWRAAA